MRHWGIRAALRQRHTHTHTHTILAKEPKNMLVKLSWITTTVSPKFAQLIAGYKLVQMGKRASQSQSRICIFVLQPASISRFHEILMKCCSQRLAAQLTSLWSHLQAALHVSIQKSNSRNHCDKLSGKKLSKT